MLQLRQIDGWSLIPSLADVKPNQHSYFFLWDLLTGLALNEIISIKKDVFATHSVSWAFLFLTCSAFECVSSRMSSMIINLTCSLSITTQNLTWNIVKANLQLFFNVGASSNQCLKVRPGEFRGLQHRIQAWLTLLHKLHALQISHNQANAKASHEGLLLAVGMEISWPVWSSQQPLHERLKRSWGFMECCRQVWVSIVPRGPFRWRLWHHPDRCF